MTPSPPVRVLVAGGGVAALEAVLALRSLAGDRIRVELLAPAGAFAQRPYSVRSPFGGEPAPEVSFDRTHVTHHHGALAVVDPERCEVVTTDGGTLRYDHLIVATGAQPVEAVRGATLFRGPISAGSVEAAVRAARKRAIFTVPAEASWTLPLYELALLAARDLGDAAPSLMIVSPEPRPLDLFGPVASDAVARLLDRAGVEFLPGAAPDSRLGDALLLRDGRVIAADAVIALPRLAGRRVPGLPADADGFIPIDEHARVVGVPGVYAAGDITAGPVKQGGLATQQADAAAEAIAADAGVDLEPRPYRPVLRAMLLTGGEPLYLSHDLSEAGAPDHASRSPLWWPSAKVVGRHLTGYLAGGRVA
jgi:sulfide:quinone oxidoreductase